MIDVIESNCFYPFVCSRLLIQFLLFQYLLQDIDILVQMEQLNETNRENRLRQCYTAIIKGVEYIKHLKN